MTTASKTAGKEIRRKAAEERNAAWRALGPVKQLEALDRRLGVDMGAKKQRKRLEKELRE